jgi:hypothetical protein
MHVRHPKLRQALRQRVDIEMRKPARPRHRTDVRDLRDVVCDQQRHERFEGVRGMSSGPHLRCGVAAHDSVNEKSIMVARVRSLETVSLFGLRRQLRRTYVWEDPRKGSSAGGAKRAMTPLKEGDTA